MLSCFHAENIRNDRMHYEALGYFGSLADPLSLPGLQGLLYKHLGYSLSDSFIVAHTLPERRRTA